MLDAGCGTGGLLARIAAEYPEQPASGLDAPMLFPAQASALGRLLGSAHGALRRTPREAAGFASGERTRMGSQWLAWNGKKVLKTIGGPAFLAIRHHLLEGRSHPSV